MKNNFFWQKQQQQIIGSQKLILSKYHMFWLSSYEFFSVLGDVFCQKSVISSAKTAVYYIASSFHNIFHLVRMGALHNEATMCIS